MNPKSFALSVQQNPMCYSDINNGMTLLREKWNQRVYQCPLHQPLAVLVLDIWLPMAGQLVPNVFVAVSDNSKKSIQHSSVQN